MASRADLRYRLGGMGALDAVAFAVLGCALAAAVPEAHAERTEPPSPASDPAPAGPPTPAPDPVGEPPAWPKGSVMELTWRVSAVSSAGSADPMKAVELMVAIGELSRTIRLAPRAGTLLSRNQPVCLTTLRHRASALATLTRPEVAKIAFSHDATTGYLARRGSSGDVLVVDEWERGSCVRNNRMMKVCPRSQTAVAMLPIPPGIKVHEALVEVDDDGISHPIECR